MIVNWQFYASLCSSIISGENTVTLLKLDFFSRRAGMPNKAYGSWFSKCGDSLPIFVFSVKLSLFPDPITFALKCSNYKIFGSLDTITCTCIPVASSPFYAELKVDMYIPGRGSGKHAWKCLCSELPTMVLSSKKKKHYVSGCEINKLLGRHLRLI